MYSRVVFCWVWQEAWILDNVFEKPEIGIHYARCCTSTQQEVSCDRAYQPWKGRGKVNRSLESKLTYHTWRKEIVTRLREVPKQKNIDGIWEEEVLIGWAKTTLGRKSEVRRKVKLKAQPGCYRRHLSCAPRTGEGRLTKGLQRGRR